MTDQQIFAERSGDWNPVHVDPVAARRTIAGIPIVHGIHLLVWTLECVAQERDDLPIASVRASFSRFVAVGEEVELRVLADDAYGLRLAIVGDAVIRAEIVLKVAAPFVAAPILDKTGLPLLCPDRTPWRLPEKIDGFRGRVTSASPEAWSSAFPKAATWIGAHRLAALGASTRLVGMICPGLHSLYTSLTLALVDGEPDGEIAFIAAEPRHGLIRIQVEGSGLRGTLETLTRPEPAEQRSAANIRGLLPAGALAGHHALVIGGSRGIGEVIAKIVAMAGGRVTIGYHQGATDAAAVAADIGACGGQCEVIRYSAEEPPHDQLRGIAIPTHVYYCASGRIGRPTSRFFDEARHREFLATHVHGFWHLVTAVRALNPSTRIFYPSTIYIDDRPAGLGEYVMAKTAGEMLCAEINATQAPLAVIVHRLPPLATDQNVTKIGVSGEDPVATMVAVVRDMHGL